MKLVLWSRNCSCEVGQRRCGFLQHAGPFSCIETYFDPVIMSVKLAIEGVDSPSWHWNLLWSRNCECEVGQQRRGFLQLAGPFSCIETYFNLVIVSVKLASKGVDSPSWHWNLLWSRNCACEVGQRRCGFPQLAGPFSCIRRCNSQREQIPAAEAGWSLWARTPAQAPWSPCRICAESACTKNAIL